MSSADLWEDGYPHGTVDGYTGGCQGGSCPGAEQWGLSCKRAKVLSAGDWRYSRLVAEGKTPAEIATALGETTTTAAPAPATTTTKETRMPTPNDVAKPKPAPAQPLADWERELLEHGAAEEVAETVDDPAEPNFETFTPLTTDRWTAGLSHGKKTEKLREIREWTRSNGFPGVPTHGRIPQDALAAYAAAEDEAAPAPVAVDPVLAELNADAEGEPDLPDTWPGNNGDRVDQDPTHGRVDKDIQEQVDRDYAPATLGQRVAIEQTLQEQRNLAEQGRQLASDGDDLVADGIDPASLKVPVHPTSTPDHAALADFGEDFGPRSDVLDKTRERIKFSADDLARWEAEGCVHRVTDVWGFNGSMQADEPANDRPEWADVTIPEDVAKARSLAARLEEENAHLLEKLAALDERYCTLGDELSDRDIELRTITSSLALVLRMWGEATERLDALTDAEEHLDIAEQRIDELEFGNRGLQDAVDVRDALIIKLTAPTKPWWKRGAR